MSTVYSYFLMQKHCPGMFKFEISSKKHNKKWEKLEKRLQQRIQHIRNQAAHLAGVDFTFKTHIFDLAFYAEHKYDSHEFCRDFLDYLSGSLERTYKLLDKKFHKEIGKKIFEMFENFQLDESNYQDFAGELLALELLVRELFTLKTVEEQASGGTHFDFVFHEKGQPKKEYVVEIFNIKFKEEELKDIIDWKKFTAYRINQKIEKKKYTEQDIAGRIFTFVIPLWGDSAGFDKLIRFGPFFKNIKSFQGYPVMFTTTVQYKPAPDKFIFETALVQSLIKKYWKSLNWSKYLEMRLHQLGWLLVDTWAIIRFNLRKLGRKLSS